MVQRLLFNGIDTESTGAPIRREHDLIPLAPAYEAEPLLPLLKLAEPGTKVALNPSVFQEVPITGLNDPRLWFKVECHMARKG